MPLVSLLVADGAHPPPPTHFTAADILWLLATAFGIWLFVRALLRGSGPLARGGRT
jgi:hypothetical protein